MIKIKIKTESSKKFTVFVPYLLLRFGISIVTSRFLGRLLTKWAMKNSMHQHSQLPSLSKHRSSTQIHSIRRHPIHDENILSVLANPVVRQFLTHFLKEIQAYKGYTLVDVHSHDGTQVWITL